MTDTPETPDSDWPEPTDAEIEAELDASIVGAEPSEQIGLEPAATGETQIVQKSVYRGSGFRWSFVFGAILIVIMLILMFQNTRTVEFRFLQWSIRAPLAVVILGTALVAVIIDELAGFVWRVRRRRLLKAQAELKELRRELAPPKESRFRKKG